MGNRKSREWMKRVRNQEDREHWENVPRGLYEDVSWQGCGARRLQLAFLPSFEDCYSWDIREVGDDAFFLYRSGVDSIWNQPVAIRPGYTKLEVESDELRGHLAALRQIALNICPAFTGMLGLDGTYYELALFGDESSGVRFQWWSDGPKQWEQLTKLAGELIGRFKSLQRVT